MELLPRSTGTGVKSGRCLNSEFDAIMRAHVARVIKYAPTYEPIFSKHKATFLAAYRTYTTKLFLEPFDERWAADAEARAKFEIEHQLDMRSRGAISASILSAACGIIARRHRFSGRKCSSCFRDNDGPLLGRCAFAVDAGCVAVAGRRIFVKKRCRRPVAVVRDRHVCGRPGRREPAENSLAGGKTPWPV